MTDKLLTPQTVIDDHGGELTFWLAWIHGDLDVEVQTWFRSRVRNNVDLARDLHSIEERDRQGLSTRAAREVLRAALEAHDYLAEAPSPPIAAGRFEAGVTLTTTALEEESPAARSGKPPDQSKLEEMRPDVRALVRQALFAILDEVEVHVPGADQVKEGTALLTHLAGPAAVRAFRELHDRIERAGLAGTMESPAVLFRILRVLTPKLFVRDREDFHYRLSYRLYLRARLGDYCREHDWQPSGPLYRDLDEALAALSRERLGDLVRDAEELLPEGLNLMRCEFVS